MNGEPLPEIQQVGWPAFLQAYSQQLLELAQAPQVGRNGQPSRWYEEAIADGYLGYPPANPADIEAAENRLGQRLPPSYRAFLEASDGWRQLHMDEADGKIFSAFEIDHLIALDPDLVRLWSLNADDSLRDADYFVYGAQQDPTRFRRDDLRHAIAISQYVPSTIYLLNPAVCTPAGEWEAWTLSGTLPGARRFPSFAEFMQFEATRILDGLRNAPANIRPLTEWRQQRQQAQRQQAAGDYTGAIRSYTAALQAENLPLADHCEILYERAECYQASGDNSRALADLEEALEMGEPATTDHASLGSKLKSTFQALGENRVPTIADLAAAVNSLVSTIGTEEDDPSASEQPDPAEGGEEWERLLTDTQIDRVMTAKIREAIANITGEHPPDQ